MSCSRQLSCWRSKLCRRNGGGKGIARFLLPQGRQFIPPHRAVLIISSPLSLELRLCSDHLLTNGFVLEVHTLERLITAGIISLNRISLRLAKLDLFIQLGDGRLNLQAKLSILLLDTMQLHFLHLVVARCLRCGCHTLTVLQFLPNVLQLVRQCQGLLRDLLSEAVILFHCGSQSLVGFSSAELSVLELSTKFGCIPIWRLSNRR
mmetsp:Transcript_60146/g.143358  ORF Transcript_60146/g.143358 Transcript_60146/m.143358 type:complete len:206 (+) Transcript_60146:617-1234(+)